MPFSQCCVRRMESLRLALSFLEGEIKVSLDNLVRICLGIKRKKKLMRVAQFCSSYKVRIWFSGSHAVSRRLALEERKGWSSFPPCASLSRGQASLRRFSKASGQQPGGRRSCFCKLHPKIA